MRLLIQALGKMLRGGDDFSFEVDQALGRSTSKICYPATVELIREIHAPSD